MSVADDSTDDHGHHLPAVEDWPKGFGEASWWPFITAIGAAGFYIGAALYVLGRGESALVGPMVGPGVFIASTFAFLAGLYGWVYHAFVAAYWSNDGGGSTALRWGMIGFLGSEIATFGAGFAYYFFIRAGTQWSTAASAIPDGFLGSLVVVNTAILVVSSFTLHFAHVALRKGNRSRFLALLVSTLVLGVVFIGGQVYEYYEFIAHEGFTLSGGLFESAFFGLTGLHGLHVTMGAVLIGIIMVRGLRGQYSADRHTSVSTVSMYWHFVDIVWIFLVVVLYAGSVA
ncbi:cytochrome c oxidase subunit 3 [Halobacterium salinarum]|uniref:Cox-type terminal oxidase subunit III n=4 Tax=Halobacterium salinarum TaxID=2242 RepID=Q9HRK1_HALSA|nr:heme-copper oxidase subunit III [Halobacterium salinarum]AAG19157.1 cytochrome c oxidase subunit III [Halobacterium salinarum NRC-1]MBB6090000.1 cytochrome c oxidase subunit 3 [Halobacterium salinarum]MDL0120716.1 heme-copper oxidase subunit III [Halobacterium salinarum]MDL0123949.1 heme-copper oxidase subunit III [Halobacterium salinarum]MDL0130593.1 heme-copper oxidase subunit III [Halobacterium salinarum]